MPEFIVRNFQSLEEAKVTVKGFTLLIGESSAGKSAFMRGLYAATHNRFKIGQVKNGTEMSVIKVRYEDSPDILTVARTHTGSPQMMLGKEKFAKMNRTVPPQVEAFNNFGTLEVGDDKYSLNFHDQFQKPLLLEFSQKKVMEILSTSQALDDHSAVHYALSIKRQQNRGAFRTVDAILAENNAKLSAIKYDLLQLKPLMESLEDQSSRLESIQSTLDTLGDGKEKLSTLIKLKEKESLRSTLLFNLKLLDELRSDLDTYRSLKDLVDELKILNSKQEIYHELQSKLTTDYKALKGELARLSLLISDAETEDSKCERLSKRIDILKPLVDLDERKSKIKTSLVDLSQLSNLLVLLESLLRTEKESVDIIENRICPICKHEM